MDELLLLLLDDFPGVPVILLSAVAGTGCLLLLMLLLGVAVEAVLATGIDPDFCCEP